MSDQMYIYGNGSAGNHGCEALTRSLNDILSPLRKVNFYSLNLNEDRKYGLHREISLRELRKRENQKDLKYLLYRVRQGLNYSDTRYFDYLYSDFFKEIEKDGLYMSAGGDNYSYGYSLWLERLNRGIQRKGGRTALIGCSILEHITDKKMIDDLSSYEAIVARESITFNALKESGVKTKIFLCPDPAFRLNEKQLPLPSLFEEGNTVGINISPMVIEREVIGGVMMKNTIGLINHIIRNTDMQVALIPHVVWDHTDDRKPLDDIYNYFKNTGRVLKIADYSAEELKGFISRCRYMIAARTHASIAAYSTQVPTLVIGYSVKSKGIATDLFGDHKGYVLPMNGITKENDLIKAFEELQEKEDWMRTHYATVMPVYRENALEMKNFIRPLL